MYCTSCRRALIRVDTFYSKRHLVFMDVAVEPFVLGDSDVFGLMEGLQEFLRRTYSYALVRVQSVNGKRASWQGLLEGNYSDIKG